MVIHLKYSYKQLYLSISRHSYDKIIIILIGNFLKEKW